jgi:predicted membrane-bound dolichyl-phosphate-mannose-protein mannosyltransferase
VLSHYVLNTTYEMNLAGGVRVIVGSTALMAIVAVIGQAISKLEFVDKFCDENGISREQFFAQDARQCHRRWLDYLELDSPEE